MILAGGYVGGRLGGPVVRWSGGQVVGCSGRRAGGPVGPDVEDGYLVRRAQDGYLDAFELLVHRHTTHTYRVAFRLLGNREDAQDITQEALIAAWENLAGFRGRSAFPTWLYRIVTRMALTRLTRGRVAASPDLLEVVADVAAGPALEVERALTADAVGAAVMALPVPQRVVVVLHHFEGLSYVEVAAVTGSSVAAVRSHLFRARRTLGATLAQWR